MRKCLIVFALALFVLLAGCIRSPLTARPKVIIDYVDGNIKIYVQAQELRRYDSIEIKVNQTVVINETNVYSVAYHTNLKELTLNITVVDAEDTYYYDCLIKIADRLLELVSDDKTESIKINDLPVERIMVKK